MMSKLYPKLYSQKITFKVSVGALCPVSSQIKNNAKTKKHDTFEKRIISHCVKFVRIRISFSP